MLDVTVIRAILTFIDVASAVLAVLFNSLLIYLVMTKSPKQLGAYKYLMIFISVFEIVYSLFESWLEPIHFSHGAAAVVLVEVGEWSPFTMNILNSVYFWFFGASLAIFAVHFIYRYLAVSESLLLHSFYSWRICYWTLIPLCSANIWMATSFFLSGMSPTTTELFRESVQKVFGKGVEEFVYLGFYLYELPGDGSIDFHYVDCLSFVIMLGTVMISLFMIFYFGWKCYRRITSLLKVTSTHSNRTLVLQPQLFYALVVQTLIPVCLMHIPIIIMFLLIFAGIDIGIYSGFASMTISIYPAVDPVPNFFIIKPYRKALKEMLRFGTASRVVTNSSGLLTN